MDANEDVTPSVSIPIPPVRACWNEAKTKYMLTQFKLIMQKAEFVSGKTLKAKGFNKLTLIINSEFPNDPNLTKNQVRDRFNTLKGKYVNWKFLISLSGCGGRGSNLFEDEVWEELKKSKPGVYKHFFKTRSFEYEDLFDAIFGNKTVHATGEFASELMTSTDKDAGTEDTEIDEIIASAITASEFPGLSPDPEKYFH